MYTTTIYCNAHFSVHKDNTVRATPTDVLILDQSHFCCSTLTKLSFLFAEHLETRLVFHKDTLLLLPAQRQGHVVSLTQPYAHVACALTAASANNGESACAWP